MTITLTRMDPSGADRDALIDFLTTNDWPFHVRRRVTTEQAIAAIESGAYRDDENDTFWIDDDALGRIGFVRIEDLTSSPMLDLRLAETARGRGLASEILTAATMHVFATLPNATRFEATTRQDNIAMRKVFQRCGWVKECHYRKAWPVDGGEALDCVGYAILRDDFETGATTLVAWNDLPCA